MSRHLARCLFAASLVGPGMLLSGCDSDSKPQPSMYDRQQRAMQHPFDYSPNVGNPDDISGGGLGDFDGKAMQRDADHVLNP
ncbi:MAG TPA: hypothetical protein VFC78_06580 [Tepidisphaeraceae bacterium]|nr:hypothetical protein [Tepidisphaeraceae bacterium]